MMTEELKVKVSLDTSDLKKEIKQMKEALSGTTSGFDGIDKATQGTTDGAKAATAAVVAMGATTVAQTAAMTKAFKGTMATTSKVSHSFKQVKESIKVFNLALKAVKPMTGEDFTFVEKIKIAGLLFKKLKRDVKDVGDAIKLNLLIAMDNAKNSIINNATKIKVALAGITAAITGFTMGMVHISESTREFRQAMNQLHTSFLTLGSDVETATATYEALFRVLGDTRRATETANLMAQITTNEKDLVTWTKIATGAMALFPDSLPVETFIEASNESIKVKKIVGALADAFNWTADAGIKVSEALSGSAEAQAIFNEALQKGLTVEDAFNEVLARTNNETQREVLLRAALNGLLGPAAGLYEEMNRELIKQNEAQFRLNQAMAALGKITQPVQTAFTQLKATLAEALAPAIKIVCDWLVTLIGWLTTAAAWVGAFLSVLFPGVADKISSAFSGVGSSINSAVGGTSDLGAGLEEANGTAQKLRRTLMGFDELNVVSTVDTSGGGGAAGGGVGGAGGGIDVSGIDTGDSIFKKAQDQMEEMKNKIRAFLDEFKIQIGVIAAALGLLGLANLLDHLGKAIGLGEKFHSVMAGIKKLAATAITIVLQYSLVNEFMDKYIDGEGFKNYLAGLLVSAIGTGILYSMWGPAGLTIGLAVTAVASIQSVIENGGITNLESAVVAFTGLAAAVGAFATAWSKLGLAKIVGDLGAFIALLKEGNTVSATLAAAFPKLSGVLASVGTALGGVLSAIGGVFGATGTAAIVAGAGVIVAAITGIISVITFLKNHWDEVGEAARKFFDQNIAPKIDGIRESFSKIGEALGPVGKVIGDIIAKIAEWAKSIDWLDGIGKAFDVVGGVIFGAVSGVIMGAINMLVKAFEGGAKAIEGAVDIISGAIELVVALFSGDLDKARQACVKILEGIVKEFKGLWGATVGAVKAFVDGVIDWCVKLWDELVGHSIIPDMMDDIVDCFKELPERVFKWLKELYDGVVKRFTDMWNAVVKTTQTKLGEARTTIMNGWNNIKEYFNTNIAPKFTVEYWKNKFETIRSSLQTKLGEVRTQLINSWNSIKEYFNTNIAPKFTLAYWNSKFDTIRASASEKINAAKTAFQNGWNTIKSWFTSNVAPKFTASYWTTKFNSIKDGAKAAMNGVISIVEKAINAIVKNLNKIKISIPSWVPNIGGRSFGISLSTVSIPRLAKGGIAVGSTLANIGEAGREAVLPLDNNTQWMDKLADRIAARNSSPTKVVLKVGERELGYAVIDAINRNTKQTGGLKLQLV